MDAKADSLALQGAERLATLRRSGLLDAPAEPKLDRITDLVCRMVATDVALLSLVEDTRQFFASQCGLPEPYATTRQTPLSHSFCQYVVAHRQPLVVNDARLDPLVATNEAVRDLNVIAYLGVPVHSRHGHVLGSLCAISSTPRAWTNDDVAAISDLALVAEDLIDLHWYAGRAGEAAEQNAILAREYHHRVKNALAVSAALVKLAAKDCASAEELARQSGQRIEALADAHETVSLGSDVAPLGDIVARLMAPYSAARDSRDGGPAIVLAHDQVTPVCLFLHELATNSVKYGALGQAMAVAVAWAVEDGFVVLAWRERTQAPPPRAEGFGSKLLDMAARQLGGATDAHWADGELTVTLRFPARRGAGATSR